MAEIPKELRSLLFGAGPKWNGRQASVFEWISFACLVVGIVSAATDHKLGLGATNWLLVAIALLVLSMYVWLSAYFGAKEG
jgi:hypothetical protein